MNTDTNNENSLVLLDNYLHEVFFNALGTDEVLFEETDDDTIGVPRVVSLRLDDTGDYINCEIVVEINYSNWVDIKNNINDKVICAIKKRFNIVYNIEIIPNIRFELSISIPKSR